jgi:hypothetical protein
MPLFRRVARPAGGRVAKRHESAPSSVNWPAGFNTGVANFGVANFMGQPFNRLVAYVVDSCRFSTQPRVGWATRAIVFAGSKKRMNYRF